jgi:hypothetical protein
MVRKNYGKIIKPSILKMEYLMDFGYGKVLELRTKNWYGGDFLFQSEKQDYELKRIGIFNGKNLIRTKEGKELGYLKWGWGGMKITYTELSGREFTLKRKSMWSWERYWVDEQGNEVCRIIKSFNWFKTITEVEYDVNADPEFPVFMLWLGFIIMLKENQKAAQ